DIRQKLKTRVGRGLDTQMLENDVKELIYSGLFHHVQPYTQEVEGGVVVTLEVAERPLVREIRFVGNDKVSSRKLAKKCEITVGSPLATYRIEEARRQLEQFYHETGFPHAKVSIAPDQIQQTGVVEFRIVEGPKQRILMTEFIGNTFVDDARLRKLVESRPGILWLINGTFSYEEIDADVDRLTAYSRRFGFFRARISRITS